MIYCMSEGATDIFKKCSFKNLQPVLAPTENVCQKFFFLADDFTFFFLFPSFTAIAFVLQILPQTALIAGFMFFK